MVIKHEFPEWDFISSFQLFNVSADRKAITNECRDANTKRMAKFFNLDLVQFRSQLEDLSALARAHAKSTGCDSYNAWRHTIQNVTSTARRKQAHPCDVLVVALARWAGWSLSSSGIEQSFGHGTHFATARQSAASEAADLMQWHGFAFGPWPIHRGGADPFGQKGKVGRIHVFFRDNEINMTTKVKFSAGVAQPLSAAAGTQWDKAGQGHCPQAVCRVKHRDRLDTRTAATCGR